MLSCKATFELAKGNETLTETRLFEYSTREDLFAQIRTYAKDANRRGFNVDKITTTRRVESKEEGQSFSA
jgi:hypothetical protein